MLTIFSIPKAFRGHINIIQRNAIQSWHQLHPACEIILFGNEEGTAEIAKELSLKYVPDIQRNKHGTPIISNAFDTAQQLASHSTMCFIHSDNILMSDFLTGVKRIHMSSFLMVGRRTLLDWDEPIAFDDPQWEKGLRMIIAKRGVLDRYDALDYFVFPCGMYKNMPPFAVGRAAFDNWIIYRARASGIPVIDGTEAVVTVHQNHDYDHLAGSKEAAYRGIEAQENIELAGGPDHIFSLRDAIWLLGPYCLKPALGEIYLRRRRETLPILFSKGGLRVWILKLLLYLGIRLNWWLPRLRPRRFLSAIVRRARIYYSNSFKLLG